MSIKQRVLSFCLLGIVLASIVMLTVVSPADKALANPNEQGLKRVADFYFEVATGDVRSHSAINKFGQNSDVDSAAAEDIWDGGGVWNEPTTTQVYTIASTSATDTSAGTGARTLQIYGLDSAGALQNETVTLAGTTWVTPTNQYQMIHRMVVRTAGSGGANAGVISANAVTDANVTAQVSITANQTLMSIYKIPAGSDGCITGYYASANKAVGATATVNIILKAKPTGEVWQTKEVIGLVKDGSSSVDKPYTIPNCFEPLTIIKMSADTNVDNVDISAGFDMVLTPN